MKDQRSVVHVPSIDYKRTDVLQVKAYVVPTQAGTQAMVARRTKR